MIADSIPEEELSAMIPSRDVREYAKRIGWDFSDTARAALLFHSRRPLQEKHDFLALLSETAVDGTLRGQLDRYLGRAAQRMERFRDNPDRRAVYAFTDTCRSELFCDFEPEAHYWDLQSALDAGKRSENYFIIRKEELLQDSADPKRRECTAYYYDKAGDAFLEECACSQREPFEAAECVAPCPFTRGDVVRTVPEYGTRLYGVVERSFSDEPTVHWRPRPQNEASADNKDAGIRIAVPRDDGRFSHAYVSPVMLEYSKEIGTPRADLLDALSRVYCGTGQIEDVYRFGEEYAHWPHMEDED